MAHIVVEADKSADLHLASWRPRRADVVLVQMPLVLRPQEELMLQFKSEGRKNLICQHDRQAGEIPSYSGRPIYSCEAFNQLDEAHPH